MLLIPLLVLIAIAISIDSPGGPLFRQQRIGSLGRPFTMLKFRSLMTSAPAYSAKLNNDNPLVTRIGRLLRASGLDELPQLLNVLRGEMSLVGPRPELPFIVAGYDAWQAQRLSVRPGMTGWWQIHHRDYTPMHLNLGYDIHYINCADWLLDVRILIATAKVPVIALIGGSGNGSPSAHSGHIREVKREIAPDPQLDADAPKGSLRSR